MFQFLKLSILLLFNSIICIDSWMEECVARKDRFHVYFYIFSVFLSCFSVFMRMFVFLKQGIRQICFFLRDGECAETIIHAFV